MDAMLTPEKEAQRDAVRRLLTDVRHALERWERRPDAVARLDQARADLAELFLLYRRRKAAEALRSRIGELRAGLRTGLTEALEGELAAAIDRMRATLAPYAQFVAEEERQLASVAAELDGFGERRRALEREIG